MGLSDHLLVRPLPPFKHTLAPNNVSSRVAANIRRLNLKVGDVPAAEGKTGCNALRRSYFLCFQNRCAGVVLTEPTHLSWETRT